MELGRVTENEEPKSTSAEEKNLQRVQIEKTIKQLEEDYLKILEAEKELKRVERDLQEAENDQVNWMRVKHQMIVSQRKDRNTTLSTEGSQLYR